MPNRNTEPLSFELGLLTYPPASVIPVPSLTALENWVPEQWGGLRVRRQWNPGATSGLPAGATCRGLSKFMGSSTYDTPTLVQQATNTGTGISATATWAQPTTAENTLIAIVYYDNDQATNPSQTGWTEVVNKENPNSIPGGGSTACVSILYITSSAARSGVETFTLTGFANVAWGVLLMEWDGVAAQDVNASTPVEGSGSSITAAMATTNCLNTVVPSTLWVGAGTARNTHATGSDFSAPTNGYVELADFGRVSSNASGPSNIHCGAWTRTVTATGDPDFSVTSGSGAQNTALVVAAFRAAPNSVARRVVHMFAHKLSSTVIELYYSYAFQSGTWVNIEDLTVSAYPNTLVDFAPGFDGIAYTHPDLANSRWWDGTAAGTPVVMTGSPSGRSICYYKNRFWVGGKVGNALRLYYSDIGNKDSWPANNFIDVDPISGGGIEDLRVVQDGLLVATSDGLYYVTGESLSNFVVHSIQQDLVAKAGRSICSTSYGTLIAGIRQVWLWEGGSTAHPVSRPIEDSYNITGNFATTASVDEIVHILDEGTKQMWVYDMANKAWHIETVAAAGGPGVIYGYENMLIFGTKSNTSATTYGLYYRAQPGSQWGKETGESLSFVADTGELWFSGVQKRHTPRYLWVQVRQRGGTATDAALSITPVFDGVAQTVQQFTPVACGPGQEKTVHDVFFIGTKTPIWNVKFQFAHSLTSDDSAQFDIERVLYEFDIETARPR